MPYYYNITKDVIQGYFMLKSSFWVAFFWIKLWCLIMIMWMYWAFFVDEMMVNTIHHIMFIS